MNDTLPPPLPLNAKPAQYKLVKDVRGREQWALRKRFRRSKHKGRCAGAFGSQTST